ncbi:hypothetical protein ABZS29_27740 [Kribbella sp. NPDC005582]|uniref:hypothetical protein n=1 Tax=Kribbella sp. NPDC005582 TaxID=3156893 RepID=UPI0033B613A6
MPKLTDDQLGDLLRETFADHESATDSLPKATKRRPLVPVLIAAAAVLAVLAGTVYTVGKSDQTPPVATTSPTTAQLSDADVWAIAIRRIAQKNQPAGGWKEVRLYDTSMIPMSQPLNKPSIQAGTSFVAVAVAPHQQQIKQLLGDLPAVEWTTVSPSGCPRDVAQIRVPPIRQDESGRSVRVVLIYGCATLDSYTMKVS